MSRETYNHVHCYRAVTESKRMYKCIREGCVHTLNAVTMVGRRAECAACGGILTITEDNLRRRNINHIGCGGKIGSAQHMKPAAANLPVNVKELFERMKNS